MASTPDTPRSELRDEAAGSDQSTSRPPAAAPAAAAKPPAVPEPRPPSAASSLDESESGSETDFLAISPRHRPLAAAPPPKPAPPRAAAAGPSSAKAAAAAKAAAEAEARPPALPTEVQLAQSAFVDLGHPIAWYEGIKLLLMAPVVLLKLLALAVAIPYAWAVLAVLLLGHKPQTPMRPFRQFLVRQWIHQWGRFVLFLSGFYYIPVRGWRNVRAAEECRAILVFNHPSYVDAAAIATFFTPSGVSKAGVANIPFIGLFGVALQLFFVERKGTSDRSNRHVLRGDAVAAIAERAMDRRFPLLAIAPEATTKAKPCLLKFRRGAFASGQPVCPMLLRYRYRHFNPSWGICNTPFHVYRLLAQCVNHLEIQVLPPYQPSEAEIADWALYAENVRRLMGRELGVPLVEEGLSQERQLWRMRARVNLRGTRVSLPKAKPQKAAAAARQKKTD